MKDYQSSSGTSSGPWKRQQSCKRQTGTIPGAKSRV